jgi:pimeloyl-ACP methyl ester carboxylesterase
MTPIKVNRRIQRIELAGARVPSVLQLPESGARRQAVLLLHGFSSSKERLADSMGRALAARRIASLAIDLPLHGARDDAFLEEARSNPLGLVRHWRTALAEAAAAITWLTRHEAIDPRRVHVAGYSLGSYVALQTAAASALVRSIIVAAGGDLPETPWTNVLRTMMDPLRSVKSLGGRPVLLLHGRADRTILPAQAQRLFDAASEPKELRWYDSGHVLPAAAAEDAAAWLLERFGPAE